MSFRIASNLGAFTALKLSLSPIVQTIDNEEIVGVVNNVSFPTDASEPLTRFQCYRPFAQSPRSHSPSPSKAKHRDPRA